MAVRQLYVSGSGADYVAKDDRLIWSALLPPGVGPLNRASGVRQVGDFPLTMNPGGVSGSVGVGIAAIGWGDRHYVLANDAAAPVGFTPAHETLARIDSVFAQVYDSEAGGEDAPARIDVAIGTPSGTPVAPALPAGSLRLFDVRFNAGSTAPSVTDRRTYTLADNRSAFQITGSGNISGAPPGQWQIITQASLAAGVWVVLAKGHFELSGQTQNILYSAQVVSTGAVQQDLSEHTGFSGATRLPFSMAFRIVVPAGGTEIHLRAQKSASQANQLLNQCKLVCIPVPADPADFANARIPYGEYEPPVVDDELPRGIVAWREGAPSRVQVGQTEVVPFSLTCPTEAGRCYRISAQLWGTKEGVDGSITGVVEALGTTPPTNASSGRTIEVNTDFLLQATHYFVANAASHRCQYRVSVSAGTWNTFAGANFVKLFVEDVGIRPPAQAPA